MAGEKKFFLGVGGQQTGPYTEKEIQSKIAEGEVKPDSLVWYEGLGEWQRVDTIAYFQPSFKRKSPSGGGSEAQRPSHEKPGGHSMDAAPRPVFSSKEAVFFRPKGPRPEVLAGGAALLLVLGIWYWQVNSDEGQLKVDAHLAGKKDAGTRYARFQKAESDYLLKPNIIPPEFLTLVQESATDEIGKKAVMALEGIYKKRRANKDLAALYSQLGRFPEAVEIYAEERAFPEAEQAAFKAYQTATDPKVKRLMLAKSIELLTTVSPNAPLAVERIALLDKEFPNERHAFVYYTLTPEKKMADLFDRTSFFFVESLMAHMKAEFPQMKLGGRPATVLLKEGPDRFRIAGTYKGEVVLNYDKLKNIRFEYWMANAEWNLVSTNVTNERTQWAKNNRTRYVGSVMSGSTMLSYLESVMRNQFPSLGLHEKITREAMQKAARSTASTSR